MVDTHAHLAMCAEPEAELVAEAEAAGVSRILTVGIDEESNPAAVATAREHRGVMACVGRHPNAVEDFDEAAAERIATLAFDDAVAAVGETGIDLFRKGAPQDRQERALRSHIEIAREVGKPLVIHVRSGQGADDDALTPCLDILAAEAGGVSVILHCFSGEVEHVARAIEHGWLCSFAGNVTYPKAESLREAAAAVPDELILVETDAPFLSPQPVRRERNRPVNVLHTAEAVARVRGDSLERLERLVEANAERVLGW